MMRMMKVIYMYHINHLMLTYEMFIKSENLLFFLTMNRFQCLIARLVLSRSKHKTTQD